MCVQLISIFRNNFQKTEICKIFDFFKEKNKNLFLILISKLILEFLFSIFWNFKDLLKLIENFLYSINTK